MELWKRNIE